MRKTLLILVLISCVQVLSAQDTQTNTIGSRIKWSPMHLLNRFPAIHFSYEKKLSNNWSTEFGAGYIVDLYPEEDFLNKRGLKFEGGGRKYFYIKSTMAQFYEFSLEYYNIHYDRGRTYGYECGGGECLYFRYAEYEVIRSDYRLVLSWGMNLYFLSPVIVELTTGLGITYQVFNNKGKPTDFDREFGDPYLVENEERILPLLKPGIKIAYPLQ